MNPGDHIWRGCGVGIVIASAFMPRELHVEFASVSGNLSVSHFVGVALVIYPELRRAIVKVAPRILPALLSIFIRRPPL